MIVYIIKYIVRTRNLLTNIYLESLAVLETLDQRKAIAHHQRSQTLVDRFVIQLTILIEVCRIEILI